MARTAGCARALSNRVAARRIGSWLGGVLAASVIVGQRWQHWGATLQERQRPLPGDEELPAAQSVSTQAVTIAVGIDQAWPWVAQMGYGGRAVFYSYPLVEWAGGACDTRRIHGLPDPRPGDHIPYFTPLPLVVLAAEAPRVLVLGQQAPDRPEARIDWTWAFVLSESGDGCTRLLVRMRTHSAPSWMRVIVHLVLEPAHAVLGRRQMLGIARRAQAGVRQRSQKVGCESAPAARPSAVSGLRRSGERGHEVGE